MDSDKVEQHILECREFAPEIRLQQSASVVHNGTQTINVGAGRCPLNAFSNDVKHVIDKRAGVVAASVQFDGFG
uniref:Uncharacterized protein n=1 Tax=Romanomermis culicivorax TaxID=13658 RepID=A0A915JX02_ROMCU